MLGNRRNYSENQLTRLQSVLHCSREWPLGSNHTSFNSALAVVPVPAPLSPSQLFTLFSSSGFPSASVQPVPLTDGCSPLPLSLYLETVGAGYKQARPSNDPGPDVSRSSLLSVGPADPKWQSHVQKRSRQLKHYNLYFLRQKHLARSSHCPSERDRVENAAQTATSLRLGKPLPQGRAFASR